MTSVFYGHYENQFVVAQNELAYIRGPVRGKFRQATWP